MNFKFFNIIYVVGQCNQQNDKVGQKSLYPPSPSLIRMSRQPWSHTKVETGVRLVCRVNHINEAGSQAWTGSKLTRIVTSSSYGRDPNKTLSVSGAI